jgi:hypothetical protein
MKNIKKPAWANTRNFDAETTYLLGSYLTDQLPAIEGDSRTRDEFILDCIGVFHERHQSTDKEYWQDHDILSEIYDFGDEVVAKMGDDHYWSVEKVLARPVRTKDEPKAEETPTYPTVVQSSFGKLYVNADGTVAKVENDPQGTTHYINNIVKFDLDEYRTWPNHGGTDHIDIVHIGFWTDSGEYSPHNSEDRKRYDDEVAEEAK